MTAAHPVNAIVGATSDAEGAADTFGVAKWLSLAATPTFAGIALLTAIPGREAPDMLCATAHGVPFLSGMVPMYLLMSVFHLVPWLKLTSRARLKTIESD